MRTETQDRLTRWLITIAGILVVVGIVWLLSGCGSAKREINQSSQAIRMKAEDTKQELDSAEQTGDVGEKAQPHLDKAKSNQDDIIQETDKQREALTKVEDIVPWWASLIGNGVIVVGLVAVLIILWYTGLGWLIKKVVFSIGMFIPSSTKSAAEIDAEAVVTHEAGPRQRESIAARRSSDLAYDSAFRKAKRKEIERNRT